MTTNKTHIFGKFFANTTFPHRLTLIKLSIREDTLAASCCPNIFDQQENVAGISWGRCKTEVLVERRCRRVFCMNSERMHPDNISDLQRAA